VKRKTESAAALAAAVKAAVLTSTRIAPSQLPPTPPAEVHDANRRLRPPMSAQSAWWVEAEKRAVWSE